MRLLITDVTVMNGSHFCVAGWDLDARCMVRPLPEGHHWSAELVALHGIEPGVIVDVVPTGKKHRGTFPHLSEDTDIASEPIQVTLRGWNNWLGRAAPDISPSVQSIFGGHVRCNKEYRGVSQGVYVSSGVEVRSLGAIVIERSQVDFVDSFGKLKAVIDDGAMRYQLAVSSRDLRLVWDDGGLEAVRAALPDSQHFHVRLGLARSFEKDPNKCYMMLNGVHG